MSQLKTILLLGLLTALLVGIGGALSPGYMKFFLVLALIMNFGAYFFSDRLVLGMSRARQVSEEEEPRLHAMVTELAERAGIPKPRIYIIAESQPNAFATGRNPAHGAVAVTQGLLEMMSPRELRGVLAHEIGHIVNRDILIATIAAAVATAITYMANVLQWGAIFGMGKHDDDEGSPWAAMLLAILAPIAASLIQLAISRSREYIADERGATLSGEPDALADALEHLHLGAEHIPANIQPATASLYIVNPLASNAVSKRVLFANLFSTHPLTEERVRRLRAMRL